MKSKGTFYSRWESMDIDGASGLVIADAALVNVDMTSFDPDKLINKLQTKDDMPVDVVTNDNSKSALYRIRVVNGTAHSIIIRLSPKTYIEPKAKVVKIDAEAA